MDRNTIIGMLLIGLILVGYMWATKDQREEARKSQEDARYQTEQAIPLERERQEVAPVISPEASGDLSSAEQALDTAAMNLLAEKWGVFTPFTSGTEEKVVLENDMLKLTFSTLGGRPYTINLPQYQTHDSLPLNLIDGDSTIFEMLFGSGGRDIRTGSLFFTPKISKASDDNGRAYQQLTMSLTLSESSFISYIYKLYDDDYMLDYDIQVKGLDNLVTSPQLKIDFYAPSTEKGYQNESMYTTLYYKENEGDVVSFKARSRKDDDTKTAQVDVKWIAFSHQFFSTILIADASFDDAVMAQHRFADPGKYVRKYESTVFLYDTRGRDAEYGMQLYFGPNSFQGLKKYGQDLKLESVVTVGGAMIRWINAYVVIPIFNWLNNWIFNYGIIILLLTIIIKVALFPLTYRSYKSQAVMRVLKPQVDEIGEKFPKKEDAMKKQQATMALYKKAGANPMGGCLPMLLQFPILYAMFRFFPTSIELRQEKFLWATDLSTYDSIIDLPFTIPMYGDHVSLFTLLMTVTTILSMRWNNQASASSSAMPGMKTMMYIMPVMFMVFLNNFSAGLTYYYFLANLITLGQNLVFRRFTDEEKILKKINSKKDKPKKKSRFAQRLEDIQKQQQQGARKPAPRKSR